MSRLEKFEAKLRKTEEEISRKEKVIMESKLPNTLLHKIVAQLADLILFREALQDAIVSLKGRKNVE